MDRRIRIAPDKNAFIDELSSSEESNTPFRLKADVIAFAAALGFKENRFKPFEKTDIEPIRQEVFERQGYDTLINLLAVCKAEDSAILSNAEKYEERRIQIFESYANGGLEILMNKLKGVVDSNEKLQKLLQILHLHRKEESTKEQPDLDISGLLK